MNAASINITAAEINNTPLREIHVITNFLEILSFFITHPFNATISEYVAHNLFYIIT